MGQVAYTSEDITSYHDIRPEKPGDVGNEPLNPER
jgi:hypothetical protein